MNKNTYIRIMEEVNPENVDFACIEAKSKEELIEKVMDFLDEDGYFNTDIEDMDKEELAEVREELESRVEWNEEGIYDIWVRKFSTDWVIREISGIANEELEDIGVDPMIYSDREAFISEYKNYEGCEYIYAVYGVTHSDRRLHLEYIVNSDEKLSNQEVYEVLENNDIEPNAYGLIIQTKEWQNYHILEIDEMDIDELHEFSMNQGNVDTFEYEVLEEEDELEL